MVRTACIDLPAFPLQLLLRREPDWRRYPAAVVADDRPQGLVLWANEKARAAGIVSGMRFAAALSLTGDLRAAVVPKKEIDAVVADLADRLRQFTPHVEPAEGEPGTFWLDARGLEPLYGTLDAWAAQVHADVVRAGFIASLAVGFGRFGPYAVARARRTGVFVLPAIDAQRSAARMVPLDRVAVPPAARDALAKLGVRTVGDLVDLPLDGVGTRFGENVHRLHRLASEELQIPLQPDRPDPPAMRRLILDHPETDGDRLMARIAEMLDPLLEEVGSRGRAVADLEIVFRFERLGDHVETLRPAAPTSSATLLMELVRLRMQAVRSLPDRVSELIILARATDPLPRQEKLFALRAKRELAAADRALARVRARLGDDAVVHAKPQDAHIPEARFSWEPVTTLVEAKPPQVDEPRLVRRIHASALPLPPRERHEPDGWMLRGLEQGPVVRVLGPYVVSGAWWNRPTHRDYHFAETRDGELLWVYYERELRRWFLQGKVE